MEKEKEKGRGEFEGNVFRREREREKRGNQFGRDLTGGYIFHYRTA